MFFIVAFLAAVSTGLAWVLIDKHETTFYKASTTLSLFIMNMLLFATLIETIG